jgi:lipoprotein-anchoring transpeptidase ErfK/SrfK
VAALALAGLLTAGCSGDKDVAAQSAGSGQAGATGNVPAAGKSPSTGAANKAGGATKTKWGTAVGASGAIRVDDVSLVARSLVPKIKVYSSPTGAASTQTLASPVSSGGPLVFLVQERKSDRLRVLLPVRPNESQGWVRAADVKLSQLNYRITVSTKKHELSLYRAGKVVMQEPVGLGKGTTPTPGGVFYLKELLRPSNPRGAYGPYAYGLSGYSNVLNEFLGGDGQIGIHGTSDPSSVGKDVSHGCIRMRNAAITKLAKMLPLGVPVQMIA